MLLPVHPSWLNQIELYFSIIQRKALTCHFLDLQEYYAERAKPFIRRFTPADLKKRVDAVVAWPDLFTPKNRKSSSSYSSGWYSLTVCMIQERPP